MNCNKCGTENKEGATFCKKCGNSLIPDHICKKCGTENDVDAAFCEKCGEKMKSAKQDIGEAVAKAGKAVKEKSVELGAIVADKTEAVTKQLAENKPTFTAQAQKLTTQANEAVATVQRKTGLNKYIIMGVAALLVVAIVVVAVLPLFSAAKSVEIEGSYQYGMIPIKQGDKYGFMDTKGNIAVPCIYDEVMPFENGKAQGKIDGGWKEITSEFAREYVPKMYYDNDIYLLADLFPEGLAPVRKEDSNDIYLLADLIFGWYSTPAKEDINGDNKHGFIDKTGKEVIPLIYDEVWPFFSEGLAAVRKDDESGFVDKTGKEVIPLIYDGVWPFFSEGLAAVRKDNKHGFIDKTGKEVIPLIYDEVWPFFSEGLAAVRKDDKLGFVDKTGKEVIPLIYDGDWPFFSEGLAAVRKDDKHGYIDKTGKEALPFIYDYAEPFADGLACIAKDSDGTMIGGYIDKTGKEVTITSEFKYATPLVTSTNAWFSGGPLLVFKHNESGVKLGFVDKLGKEVIPLVYDYAERFSDGLATVAKRHTDGMKYGAIDQTGKEVIPFVFDTFSAAFCDTLSSMASPLFYGKIDGRQGIIPNPNKIVDTRGVTYLYDGVYAKKSGNGYSQLENELGEKLVAFDKSLNKCTKLFADGIKQINNGNADKAKSTLIKALELQPENIHIMSALEKACTQIGDMEKAADYRSQINALSGVKSIDEKRAAAKKAYEDSDIATAYVLYTEILQEAPDDEQTYSDLAQLCISQEKYKNAAEILQIGIAATGSDTLKAVLEDIQLKADFGGETGQMLTDGLNIAERIAEATGDSDKLELGKELYSILRNLQ